MVVESDGSIWFTDSEFGILGFCEGERAEPELLTQVYRIDALNGAISVVTDEVKRPNGLCSSPDGSVLYMLSVAALHNALWLSMWEQAGRC